MTVSFRHSNLEIKIKYTDGQFSPIFLSKKEEYFHLAQVDFDFGQVHIVWWLSYCQVEEKITVEPCSGWQEMVSLCSLIRLIGMYADRDQPEFLYSRLDSRYLWVHVATVGGCQRLLTHYRWREVRNSIYRYRKVHIDYRLKFSYLFISFIVN